MRVQETLISEEALILRPIYRVQPRALKSRSALSLKPANPKRSHNTKQGRGANPLPRIDKGRTSE